MPVVLKSPLCESGKSAGNEQNMMDKLFSLLAEAEAAVSSGGEWLTPEEVDATVEV
ncbi:MAG: hypothetical protein Ta2A_26400 [Treponemataceae bacterium]|nr:MAG: hypothetical protein Ta2A_26400 [Treponemataceae bacterium]